MLKRNKTKKRNLKGTVVDGHNRYAICKKHNVPFDIIERDFDSRYNVMAWILDKQRERRNVNKQTMLYIIGRRYLLEKNENGVYNRTKSTLNKLGKNCQASDNTSTSYVLAGQLKVSERTVRNAAELVIALDKIIATTGITYSDILSGKISGTLDEIKDLAEKDERSQKRVIDLILNEGELSLKLAFRRLWDEQQEERRKETEEKRKQLQEEARLNCGKWLQSRFSNNHLE